MKHIIVGLALMMALAISACGGAGSAITAHKLAKDPNVQRDVAQAKAKINKCGGVLKLASPASRNKVIACIAPPSKRVQLESCISKAASKNHLWRKSGRQQFIVDVAGCVVQ